MVGLSVVGNGSAPVKDDYSVKVWKANVVDYLVHRALYEGRVNADDGQKSALCKACGECHRVLLGDSHVKKTVGIMAGKGGQACSLGHRRGYGSHFGILLRQAHDRARKIFCEAFCVKFFHRAVGDVERAYAVKKLGVVFGGRVALSLFCDDMNHDWLFELLDALKNFCHFLYVVAVERACVFKAKVDEHVVAEQKALESALEAENYFLKKSAARQLGNYLVNRPPRRLVLNRHRKA